MQVSDMGAVGGLRVCQCEVGGLGIAHLVTWHPCCCHSFSHLFFPPSHPTPALEPPCLPGAPECPSFAVGLLLVGGVLVVTSRCDLGRLTWDIVMFTAIPGVRGVVMRDMVVCTGIYVYIMGKNIWVGGVFNVVVT